MRTDATTTVVGDTLTGPLFTTLPHVFARIPGGWVFGFLLVHL